MSRAASGEPQSRRQAKTGALNSLNARAWERRATLIARCEKEMVPTVHYTHNTLETESTDARRLLHLSRHERRETRDVRRASLGGPYLHVLFSTTAFISLISRRQCAMALTERCSRPMRCDAMRCIFSTFNFALPALCHFATLPWERKLHNYIPLPFLI